jgi:hypothetical protein
VYFAVQVANVPFVLGVEMSILKAKYDMYLENLNEAQVFSV